MGMISEINAEFQCQYFEQVLKEAMETDNRDVIEFMKKTVYPQYQKELGEAWRTKPTELQLIVEEYYEGI